ncbi:hypothetical protein N7509_000952 [Penicillium cosmopolitanum]|uniref:Xylanolytic transcriptional activator regulatory domain-containing protein n=1 Tax=Penicillium cosmopolitanum TaxID=1131564 RepID=A0A9W9WB85_9EURO|nr:uncharacterized protein N7509_000952 [Penicillium cosmopolitanum]KAJ5414325.1 hypothetical protein N7509_000952 [Penicillium cosmopolitanum]
MVNSISEPSHNTTRTIDSTDREHSPELSHPQMAGGDYARVQANLASSDDEEWGQKISERRHAHPQIPRVARSVSPPTPRFVGDLNPEARLLEEQISPEDVKHTDSDNVGLWIHPGSSKTSEIAPSNQNTFQREPTCYRSMVSDIISHKTVEALSRIYFANVHPIVPLLNEDEYWQGLARGAIATPLVHVVCLIAAKDSAAEKDLRLLHSKESIIPVRKFCSRLYSSITSLISHPVAMRKITMMRVLGLLSLHQEGSDGGEHASSYISQAIHYAQSLALHLPRPNDTEGCLKRAFWCLWTLDRLNSATNSRPCFIADMDIAVSDLAPEESGFVAFNVWFRVAKMLNKVIGLYRPHIEKGLSGWDSGFPGFEQIMDEMSAWGLPGSTIGL